jgi:acyl carrier protein
VHHPEALCSVTQAVVTDDWSARVGARTKGGTRVGVETKVKEVLLEILDINEDDIVPTAKLSDDLKAASIDLVDIIAALENAFDVDVEETQVMKLQTVQDTIDIFKAAIAAKNQAF